MTTLAELIATHADALAVYGDDYPQIAALLNAPTVIANPNAGEKVITTTTTPITMDAITALVPTEEAAIIYVKAPNLIANMQQAIDANNRAWLGYLLQTAASPTIGALSEDTIGKLAALLEETTTTEHTAPATMPGPSLAAAAGLSTVTAAAVQAALNA